MKLVASPNSYHFIQSDSQMYTRHDIFGNRHSVCYAELSSLSVERTTLRKRQAKRLDDWGVLLIFWFVSTVGTHTNTVVMFW